MLNIIITRLKINVKIKRILAVQVVIFVIGFLLVTSFQSYSEDYKKEQQIVVGIVNNDSSTATHILISSFKNMDHFSGLYNIVDISDQDVEPMMENNQIDAAITLPEGFAEGLYYFDNKPINMVTKTSIPTKNAILRETLTGFSDYVKAVDMASDVYNKRLAELDRKDSKKSDMAKAFNLELLTASLGRASYFDIQTVSNVPIVSSMEYFMSALPISFITFVSIMSGLRKLKEDSLNVAVRIELAGISRVVQAVAFYISETLNALVLIAPLILYSMYSSGVFYGLRLALSIIICYVFWSAIWRIIANISKSRETLSITCISISFISCLVAGGIVPYLLLPTWAKMTAEYSINFALCRYVLSGEGLMSVFIFAPVFGILFAIDVFMNKWRINEKYGRV